MSKNRKEIFSDIFLNRFWGGRVSASGPGSDLEETVVLRRELPLLFKSLSIKSVLDAPCGDFNWMKETDYALEKYIGMDIVPAVVSANERAYGNAKRSFLVGDIVQDALPCVDFILCRDCLAHLPAVDVLEAIRRFKESGSTYLAATTFPNTRANADIVAGQYRSLNLQIAPINLPTPFIIIDEQTPIYDKKMLGVWKVGDL
jgi:SAM-dependent methyltransferase